MNRGGKMGIKTKDLIIEVFFDLLKKESLEQISVTDLVEECKISRQTFYYHFKDIPAMLDWIFKTKTDLAVSLVEKSFSLVDIIKIHTGFTKEVEAIIIASLNTASFLDIFNRLQNSYKQIADVSLTKHYRLTGKNKHYASMFWSGSVCALVITEAQKPNPNFEELFKKIGASLPKA